MRKTVLGEQVKAEAADAYVETMTDDLIAFHLGKLAHNIRYLEPTFRAAVLREAARRITKVIR